MSLTKAQLSALTDTTIYENSNEQITATGVNILIKDIIDSLALETQLTGGTPAGTTYDIQFNNAGAFDANPNLTFNFNNNSGIIAGFENTNTDSNSTIIGGGQYNKIYCSSQYSSIIGGAQNIITTYSYDSSIIGGRLNIIQNYSQYSSIVGGKYSTINCSYTSSIIGSSSAVISGSCESIIVGGSGHIISSNAASIIGSGYISNSPNSLTVGGAIVDSSHAATVGGSGNGIYNGSNFSIILGGSSNVLGLFYGGSCNSAIVAGNQNQFLGHTSYKNSVIVGGHSNTIGYSTNGTVLGGTQNTHDASQSASIVGGEKHCLLFSPKSIIGGGNNNNICTSNNAAIIGGTGHTMTSTRNAVIIGGHGLTPNGSTYNDSVIVPTLFVKNNLNVTSGGVNHAGVSGSFTAGINTVTVINGVITAIV